MRTRNLETMLCVVRLGGVGAAARHLNVTQPTVTRRIQELERDLGARLFERVGRLVTPTAMARHLLSHAERALLEVAAIRMAATDRAAIRGTVRAGIAELIALTWFDRLLLRIAKTFPDVVVEMEVDLASRLVDKLARRDLDIVFLPGPVPIASAVRVDIGHCPVHWVGAPGLIEDRTMLSPASVAALPIIMSPQGSDVHGIVMRWFGAASVQPRRLSLCNSLSMKMALARKGLGIVPLSTDLIAGELASGELVALPEHPPLGDVNYSAAYIPSHGGIILPQVAAFAEEESWFQKECERSSQARL